MPDATVTANTPQTTVLDTDGTIVLLTDPSGNPIPFFNQGSFGDVVLPVPATNGKPRTLPLSGCGMCALVSYLAASGCCATVYHPDSKQFFLRDDGAPIDPRSFNQYLLNYIDSKTTNATDHATLLHRIYAPDGEGALRTDSGDLRAAIDQLAVLSVPTADEGSTTPAFQSSKGEGTAVGIEIADMTAHIDAGNPAMIGVSFDGDSEPWKAKHQILVVGHVRFGASVYYVVLDSGFAPNEPYAGLGHMSPPFSPGKTLRYCASRARSKGYGRIVWYRKLSGLSQLTVQCMPAPEAPASSPGPGSTPPPSPNPPPPLSSGPDAVSPASPSSPPPPSTPAPPSSQAPGSVPTSPPSSPAPPSSPVPASTPPPPPSDAWGGS